MQGKIEIEPGMKLDYLLEYLRSHEVFMLLNSNKEKQPGPDKYSSFDWALAAGVVEEIIGGADAFKALSRFSNDHKDWAFGVLSYDLKNSVEQLTSGNYDGVEAPLMHFFIPQQLYICKNGIINDPRREGQVEEELFRHAPGAAILSTPFQLKQRVSKEEYIASVNSIKGHIHRGDIYEMNYCIEFYTEEAVIDPFNIYRKLAELSPTPFSCFYRNGDLFLISASPERYLKKEGNMVISQPMKGTARRGMTNEEDLQMKQQLKDSAKEQSENVMIVDLVRNDLSKHAVRAQVKVEELFGVYTFPLVHQMVSTVKGELKAGTDFTDVIRDTFPMGSMTGAPKVSAMQLIEHYEKTKRGLYSGAIGYITPEKDFDFNVVIRSILYNSKNHYLSFMVGSAITAASDAAREYEECMLKAKAMMEALKA